MVRGAVIIAKGDQRAKYQDAFWFRGLVDGTEFILDYGGIFTMHHEDPLLDLQAGHAVEVDTGKGSSRNSFEDTDLALGINGAGILVGR